MIRKKNRYFSVKHLIEMFFKKEKKVKERKRKLSLVSNSNFICNG